MENPIVTAAALGVDVAALQVKINEGALYPTVTASAGVNYNAEPTPAIVKTFSYALLGTVSVPLFQGGAEYATIRQSKETLGQRRMDLDTQRDSAQQSVVQSWGQLEAAKAQIIATQAQVTAAETALNGVREEARVGQRTTLDVLNAQQELVNARVALVTAQRDRVVASYSLLSATGRLSVTTLGLKVADLRSAGPLPAGARQLGRRAHAGRPLTRAQPDRPQRIIHREFDLLDALFEFTTKRWTTADSLACALLLDMP